MYYLFFEVWLLLLISFVFGWVAHWFYCCRDEKGTDDTEISNDAVESKLPTE